MSLREDTIVANDSDLALAESATTATKRCALQLGSPAINAGDPNERVSSVPNNREQRGIRRQARPA